jgi:hypothetical protein
MKTTYQVQQSVQKKPRGQPFTASAMLQYGTRAAVDQALCRLASSGKVVRLTRGVYVRPEENRFVGQVLPEPLKVAEVIAKKTHGIVQVSGVEAARQFGFTTQVPAQPVFLTTGHPRKFQIGNLTVNLKHVSRKKLPFPESKVGVAILALWYLGKQQVNSKTIEIIKKKLTPKEFEKFISATEYMPAWMTHAIIQYKKENERE